MSWEGLAYLSHQDQPCQAARQVPVLDQRLWDKESHQSIHCNPGKKKRNYRLSRQLTSITDLNVFDPSFV